MKLNKFIAYSLFMGAITLASCSEEVDIAGVDLDKYVTNSDNLAVMTDLYGNTNVTKAQLKDTGSSKVSVSLTAPAENDYAFSLEYDESVLTAYNAANATDYEALPSDLVVLPGAVNVLKGNRQSEAAVVEYYSSIALDEKTYAIPLRLKTASSALKVSQDNGTLLLLVNNISKSANCDKSTGIKMVSCMDVSHTNPLNMLLFTLKDSGKPFFDMVILFSSNIRYNEETGRPYLCHDASVKKAYDNYETYLKPLQEKGMKVILSVMPDHDGVGLANLSDSGCQYVAQQLADFVEAHHLDGVFFDEEYAEYSSYPRSGADFTSDRGSARAARLFYECKKLMPDKLMISYAYSTLSSLPAVEGVQSGDFVDIALNDYLVGTDRTEHFPGMLKSEMGLYSQEFALNRYASVSQLQTLRNGGYGYNMCFDLNPFNFEGSYSFPTDQVPALERTCSTLFDEELVYPSPDNLTGNYYQW